MSRSTRTKLYMATTVVAFVASFLLTGRILPILPLRGGPFPRIQRMPPFDQPRDDCFFVSSAGRDLSQMVLYHGLGASMDNARRADLLFLGNSRVPMGLREEVIVPAAEKLGLRAFSLACGHGEQLSFALELIRRHDLRPKVVVACGGPESFLPGMSRNARDSMAMTRWDAWKRWREDTAAWELQVRLHSRLPRIDFLGQNLVSSWIVYRSERTGWWQAVREPTGHNPIGFRADWSGNERLLPLARELHDELSARGARLVLTMTPYRDTWTGHIPFLAKELGVPAILPPLDGMTMSDESHLDRQSALRFSRIFWRELVALPEVRDRLSIPAAHE